MNQNQTSTNEAQIRELVESWATAVRNKDMEDILAHSGAILSLEKR